MKRWVSLLVVLVVSVVFAAGAVAQDVSTEDDGFIFRANGDIVVAPNEVLGSVIVADGDATVDGRITDTLWVISGDAIVAGTVGGDTVVIDGTLSLAPSATVENVMLVRGTLDRAQGATVTGEITEQDELVDLTFGWGAAVFSVMMWFGITLALIVAALLFVRFGGQQLAASGEVLRRRFGMSALTGLAVWIGLPILAVLAFATVVGIPLGVAIVLFLLPALWVVGYLVASAKVGDWILGATGFTAGRVSLPYLAAALGVLLFQLIGLVPAIGALAVVLAGLAGSGALIYRLVGRPEGPAQQPAPAQQPQPHPAA